MIVAFEIFTRLRVKGFVMLQALGPAKDQWILRYRWSESHCPARGQVAKQEIYEGLKT